ncbi:plastocyanin/azurin family copper-binding protein [Haloarcula amylovorans]|uniref:plastocyanin/azurin family copper-binding protein n=1 Tax=Haloarcula amylovorans TaxID=2562280 RepID=UPI0010769E41|nr:plastocyanin/azurin family copper-binding protein [Halomicroarcula amylolytica]
MGNQSLQPDVSRREFFQVAAGAAGVTGTVGRAAAQEGDGGGGETVTIDMTDDLVFDPDERTIAPGTTVVWENVGGVGHSVTAYEDEIPAEAEFFASGGSESEEAARGAYPQQGDVAGGETYEHTFDVEGEYGYFCIPHETVGMVASLTVTTEPQGGGDGGVQEGLPSVPEGLITLGVGAAATIFAVFAFAYFFLKYGGDYGEG